MIHARLMSKFNSNALELIENWNYGYYNVNGFDKARQDVEKLFIIKYFCDYFEDCKKHEDVINRLLDGYNINVKLSLKNFKILNHMFNSYNESLDIISKKLSINLQEIITKCNEYRFPPKKSELELELFTFDLVPAHGFSTAIQSFDEFLSKQEHTKIE